MGRGSRDIYTQVLAELREIRGLMEGIAVPRGKPGKTFGELSEEWFSRISPRRVRPSYERGHLAHLAPLADLREGELTKKVVDELFGKLLRPHGHLAEASINKLRSTGRQVVADAQGNEEWFGVNPFGLTRRLREPRRLYCSLSLAELKKILPFLRPDRRRLVKTVLFVGLRPGEALGLKKSDIDLERRVMSVRRSHGRDRTKTGREREFPIPDELVPDLRMAIKLAPGEFVFPRADGTRQREDTKLSRTIKAALKDAGVVVGYRFKCRREGCGHHEDRKEESEGLRCPVCNFKLWCVPIPKPFRFYDLRHSAATLHTMAKCDPLVIREMLGHAARNITEHTYIHLDDAYRRAELNKLKLRSTRGKGTARRTNRASGA